MGKEKLISIVVAAYNEEKFISRCITSCVNASERENVKGEIEIIVVDDASNDNTLSELTKFENKIDVISHEKNEGLGAVRNTGLEQATGQYVWFIDGDDFIETGFLSLVINTINDLEPDVLTFEYTTIDEENNYLTTNAHQPKMPKSSLTGAEFYELNYLKSYTPIFIFNKKLFSDGVRFQERINMQDSEILPKLLFKANSVVYLPQVGYNYFQHTQSFTNSTNFEKRYKYFESIIVVRNSLMTFRDSLMDRKMIDGINKKLNSLHDVILSHLVFFPYDKKNFLKIINLLKNNNLYPLASKPKGKLRVIRNAINVSPIFSLKILNLMR